MYAEKGLEKIVECGRILEALWNEELYEIEKIKDSKGGYHEKMESVCFKEKVLRDCGDILKEISSLPLSHKLLS